MEPLDYREDRVLLESQAVQEIQADQDKRVSQDYQEPLGKLEETDHLGLPVPKE